MLLTLLLSCTWLMAPAPLELAPPSGPATRPEARDDQVGFTFAREVEAGAYRLPPSSRPDGAPAPERIPIQGTFRKGKGASKAQTIYKTPLPVRSNLMTTATYGTHFVGTYAPPGMEVLHKGVALPFRRFARTREEEWVWGFSDTHLLVGVPLGQDPPGPGDIEVRFAKATAAEDALNHGTSGLTVADFTARTLTLGDRSHSGLLLPAPAQASWTVTVPESGRIGLRATVVPPAIASAIASDGATVHVEVVADGQTTEIGRGDLHTGAWTPVRGDLAPWAGRDVEIRFRTEPGAAGDATFDYVLLEAPAMYVATERPRRFALIFVDTLRPDHMGMYGYDRPTTPNLDMWAQHAVRFTEARSVAPWTLPSARAMLTGRQPEAFYDGPTLADRLARAGWRTDAFVTNAFLSQPFDLHRGWDQFDYIHLDDADHVAEQAVGAMSAWPDRDTFVMVHLMEPHLPYREGRYHGGLWAGSRPEGIEYLSRKTLSDVSQDQADFGDIRQHVVDRYDQNIRAVDDALVPLLEAAGPDATVVFVSDHGEEFWDHGHFEHGHTFYDELLRVPFLVRSPHLPPGTSDAPVSLLDVTPTLLELAGLAPEPDASGQSLVGASWGAGGAEDALRARPQGFGRPLYGEEGWGVLTGGHKFWERGGARVLHTLEADPLESLNMASPGSDPQPYLDALAEALNRGVLPTWNIELRLPDVPEGTRRTVFVTLGENGPPAGDDIPAGGFLDARKAYDPRGRLDHASVRVDGGVVTLELPADRPAPDDLIVYPSPGLPVESIELRVRVASPGLAVVTHRFPCTKRRTERIACIAGDADHRFVLTESWSPVPGGVEVSGFHPDVAAQLAELGYIDE